MAGAGRRTFTPGEVLTASNVMNYLQDQAVMNFAGTAARGSAIGTAVSEGMVSYLADTNVVQAYDGSAWNSLAYATAVPTLAGVGLVPIIPTGVSTITGTASYSADGTITLNSVGACYIQGVFTSAYRNYHVVIDVNKNTSAANYLGIQLAVGTTESTTGYHVGSLQCPVNSTTFVQNGTYNGGYAVISQMYYDTGRNYANLDIYRPALAQETGITGVAKADTAAIPAQSIIGGNHGVQTAYNTLKVLVTANTMSGYVKVFGWN